MIGIDRNNWLVYEGVSLYGHGVWPTPMVMRATIVEAPEDWGKLPTSTHIDNAKYVFREDTFDPVTGLRRGRLYQLQDGQVQPSTWHVNQHPVIAEDVGPKDHSGRFRKDLLTYYDVQSFGTRLLSANTELVIALGAGDAMSLWTACAGGANSFRAGVAYLEGTVESGRTARVGFCKSTNCLKKCRFGCTSEVAHIGLSGASELCS